MKTRKSLLAAAIAMSLGVSGFAFADQGGDGDPNTNADNTSTANNDQSGNTNSGNDNSSYPDNSTNDSGNDNSDNSDSSDNSSTLADSQNDSSDGSTNDSGNDNSDNSTNDSGNDESDSSVNDSYNTADSNNDNSDNSSMALNMDVFMNNAELNGTVSGTSVTYGNANADGSYTEVRNSNEISGGSANFTGVGAFAQNAGNGSVTQANVSVMSNLSTGGGGGTQ